MTRRSAEWLAALLLCAAWAPAVGAQDDWPHWGRDAGNQRHSPLTQIDTNNVSTLVPAWRYEMRKEGRSVRHAQSTPLVVGGVLYLSFPFYHVVALEPETGELIWEYTAPGDWNSPEHQLHYNGLGSMRGLAYWKGDGVTPPQIVFATEEGDLISLDAATGIPNPRFGIGGFVDLRTPEVMRGFSDMTHYGISSGVAIYKHLVYTGAHIVDETGSKGPAGDTRAWDLRTGDLVWTFHTVPQPGEVGHETWHDDSWRNATGANNWSFFGIDEERGILYMPLGSANNDFYGVDRPGDNLFANSIVAVDAETGALKWYFQAVHHDLWDYDMPVPPMLFDVERDGETIPAVGVMTKFPLLFIFDRVTGESIYEIEERPVPAGSIPGEYYSPTQPFPVKPPPLGRISFTMDDIATITPAHEAACRSLMIRRFDGYHPGPFTPPSPGGALMLPSKAGGAEFTGGTFDPSLGYYIINTADTGQIVRIVEADDIGPPESPRLYRHVPRWGRVGGWPCWQPPWSRLTAVHVDTGEIAWQIPFGTVGGALAGVETGAPDSQKGGPTSTAGGVFFIGGATDRRFRAYETRTGRELWSVQTEELINGANPITYMGSDGKQYVAVVAGTKLLTFTLPPNRSPVSVDGLPALVLPLSDDAAAVDVDVSVAFRDPDGDALAYEASSSSASVATVSVSGSTLTVTPVAGGKAAVTVKATDVGGSGTSASRTFTVTVPPAGIDYDADDNGLLEVETPAQLDAVRYDLDGDGVATEAGAAAYEAAFPDTRPGRGCAGGGCRGYELVADLDLDTNGNGEADAGDAFWNDGAGWDPIGGESDGFEATFAGNGRVVRGLFIKRTSHVGLFGAAAASSVIHGVGLVGVDIRGETQVGGLVGVNRGTVRWSYATGAASGSVAGGLVGENHGTVAASYSTAVVTGGDEAGGLVGSARSGSVVATYATGRVSGTQGVGGLVGSLSGGALTGSYATGRVTGTSDVGGLVGSLSGGTLTSSYWDTETTGHETGSAGRGLPTSALQASDWYSTDDLGSWWNLDVDGDGGGDLPWLFGGTAGYLALWPRNEGWSDWVEFGHQVRSGPSVTATVDADGVAVSWTAVDVSHWRPAPPVTYAVYRTSAAGVERVATGLTERTYADTALSAGTTYAYQVAAEVWGGEPARSRRTEASTATTPLPVNDSPVSAGSLAALTLAVADGAATVEVGGAFSDPDGDALTFGAASSAPAVATVTVSGSTVTVTPVSAGAATVTVTATDVDGSNTSASQSFTVTVPNRSPVSAGSLAALTLAVADGAATVEVGGAFSDPDGDALTFGAASSAPAVATVTVSGSTVTVTPVSAGAATVTVTATDVDGSNTSASQLFTVTVPNRSPVSAGSLAALTLAVADGAATVEVGGAFSDPDGDALTFGAASSAPAVATVTVSGSTVTVTPVSAGAATVTVTATDVDGSNTSASQSFTVTVPNRSPVSAGSLAALTLAVADGAATVEVGGAFSDPDGDALTFGAASSAPAVATVTVSGSTVTVTPVSAGAATVTVTATDVDGSNTSASQLFTVTVPNRSPVSAGSLAALTLAVADGAATVEVGGAFSDPDGDALTFGAASSAPAVATVTVSGSTVTVTPVSAGAATVTVTATDVDGSNTSASQSFTVTVPNRSPVSAGSLAALTLAVADGAATVEVGGAFSDPDGDALTFGAASSAPAVATVTVSGSTVTVTPVSAGAATVTVTATDVDGSNTSASQSFTVTVPNRSPVSAGSLAALTLAVADGAATVEVGGAFSDPDGDALTFGAASSAPAVATVTVSGSTVTVTPVSAGAATVTVTATDVDGSNTSASQSFTVTVPATDVDYDADDDGLIEIRSLAQLDAVRHDLDGDGVATRRGATTYGAAFSDAAAEMGCPATGCTGYELTADLGFDTNGNGTADAGDAWWNRGSGWVPLGSASSPFTSTFWGNGHTVSHLFIRDAARDHVGLFGMSRGVVGGVGLVEVDVSGRSFVGGLVGKNEGGRVTASHTTGRVSGYSVVGGLVGWNAREIREHESGQPNHVSGTGVVTASYSTAQVSADFRVGGLVGLNWDRIAASYATGSVTAQITQAPWLESSAGGLVGMGWYGSVAASYATGEVSGPGRNVGGLTGNGPDDNEVTASYWDTESSGVSSGGAGSGRTTSALQEPMGYTGLYASWAVDVDGDGEADRPWDFGTSTDYPVLSLDVNGDGEATWREVGGQGRTETAAPASSSASSAGVATTRGVPRPAFTDDPLVAGTPVRAVQLLELRSRIDGLRRGLGLLGFSWTDATIVRGVTPARAVHLTDLRTALEAAYAAAGREAPVYTDAVVTAGVTALRAVHLQELRAAVAALEQRRSPTAGRTGENPAAGPPVRSVVPSI